MIKGLEIVRNRTVSEANLQADGPSSAYSERRAMSCYSVISEPGVCLTHRACMHDRNGPF